MNSRIIFAAIVALAVVVAAALGAWWALYSRPPAFCELSDRPIHRNMHTVVRVDGKTRHACCARCALILAAHTNQQVEIVEVTDYVSGQPLATKDAYYVEASRVEVCSMPRLRLDESRTAYVRLFDRCSPSTLAFAREDEARDFIAKFGGSLKRLEDLPREAGAKRSTAGER